MTDLITIQNIGYIVGAFGVAFGIYNRYFRDPLAKSDTTDAVLAVEIKQLKEEIQNLKDNHIHSLEVAITNTNFNLNILTVQVAKLATVIDERVPKLK